MSLLIFDVGYFDHVLPISLCHNDKVVADKRVLGQLCQKVFIVLLYLQNGCLDFFENFLVII